MIDTFGTIVLWGIPALAAAMVVLDNKNIQDMKKKK